MFEPQMPSTIEGDDTTWAITQPPDASLDIMDNLRWWLKFSSQTNWPLWWLKKERVNQGPLFKYYLKMKILVFLWQMHFSSTPNIELEHSNEHTIALKIRTQQYCFQKRFFLYGKWYYHLKNTCASGPFPKLSKRIIQKCIFDSWKQLKNDQLFKILPAFNLKKKKHLQECVANQDRILR